jgi:hypothetical protein
MRLLTWTALIVTLVACNGIQRATPVPAGAPNAASSDQHATHGGSWMGKGLKQRDLLYVSNANGTVNVYRYWQRTLVGILTNFKLPMGACSDRAGNVYIVDNEKQKIYEYAHAGKKAIKVLDDSPYGRTIVPSTPRPETSPSRTTQSVISEPAASPSTLTRAARLRFIRAPATIISSRADTMTAETFSRRANGDTTAIAPTRSFTTFRNMARA